MTMLRASLVGIPLRFLLSAVVGTIISVSAMSHATAGPGECPVGVTPSFIDTCYIDWLARTQSDPVVDVVTCSDNRSSPNNSISVRELTTTAPQHRIRVRRLRISGGRIVIFTTRFGGQLECVTDNATT